MNLASRITACLLLFGGVTMLPLWSAAQSNFQPGVIVTANGDTVKGLIDYPAWHINPRSILFKATQADRQVKTFSVSDINFFSVGGLAAYQKFVCTISTDVTDVNHLAEGRDTSFRTDTVLLKILQKGKNIALYAYTDDLKARYYVGEAPDYKPVELTYRKYLDHSASASADNSAVENGYQRQLFALAAKYHALDDKSTALLEDQFLKYQADDLLKITSLINGLSDADFKKNYRRHGKISYYAGILANSSGTTSAKASGYTTAGGHSSSSLLPGAVFGIVADPNPDNGNVDFRLDISLNPSTFDAVYPLKVIPYGTARAAYDQLGIYVNPHVIFNIYSSPGFKFYLGLGASVNLFVYSSQYFEAQGDSSNPYFPKEPFYFNQVNVAFMVTGGFRIGSNWEIYFNYFTPTSTTGGDYFYFSDQVKQAGITYFFHHK